ncbi:hypothetical protein ONS95_013863 [Cadophora gregata]|uniref:uncharacterized protein n=1 Tax=Cadophora gregata TaxID=51156 RepID=UPI0026DA88FD|nr:uncharacterized protein ONS95_013863 [Cadophora gregata]KAK0113618.1 hypothetical protein ONS96_014473 [Cadophora gregata f. sp. sojae]KAK0114371.1 hypothetical protein ONS95_013863 [Cadophora gregata]
MSDYRESEYETQEHVNDGEYYEQETAEVVEETCIEEEPLEEEPVEEEPVEEEPAEEERVEEERVEEESIEEDAPCEERLDEEDRSLEFGGLQITLENRTNAEQVFAYITGQLVDEGNKVCFVKADGKTLYVPEKEEITEVGSEVPVDCAIRLGATGETVTVTIPHIAGGRIWFSLDQELTFKLNPGPAIAEPSVTNASDPNINTSWGFCEFTYTQDCLYANISYVDFVSLPISMSLTTERGEVQSVAGLYQDGLQSVVDGIRSMEDECPDWQDLIVESDGKPIRVLSPNNARVMSGGQKFEGYYDEYVNACWDKYRAQPLIIDTQASYGVLEGWVNDDDLLRFEGHGTFSKPSTGDIFSCSTNCFRDNKEAMGPLTARISAALNRSTLLTNDMQPTNEQVSEFYTHPVTNHYSRLVHLANADGRGYAFPYDDVPAPGDVDQSGFVTGKPQTFAVCIG